MSPRPGALGTLAAAQLVITARLACPPVTTPLRSLVAGPSRLPWSPPPSGPRLQTRTLFTRATSFWAPSYPPPTNDQSWVPAIPPRPGADLSPPPLPAPSPVTQENIAPSDGRRSRIKERYLDSLMDKAGELGLQCSILDSHGNWTAEEGSYRKMDLCRAHDLDPRDLRKLDSLNPSLVPIILTRRSCILISILHIRALIKPDRVIIFNAPGTEESEAARRFKAHLQANVQAGLALERTEREKVEQEHPDGRIPELREDDLGLSYEHRALESILVDTANALEEEMGFVRRLVEELLESFEHDINRDNLRKLLHYSRRLAGFQSRAKYIKSAVDELLDSDEDLSAMYISDRLQGKPRALHDHEQLELLFESFSKQVEEIVSEIDTMVANVQSTQEVAELMLDSGRNALLALDIKISMATMGVGVGALVAGLFGMNLVSGLEDTPHTFFIVTGGAGIVALLVYWYSSRVLRKVRHVALVGRPTSLPESVRMAKERFVRERAEYARAEAQAEYARVVAECGGDPHGAAATMVAVRSNAATAAAAVASTPIPDYEARWHLVRRGLRARSSWWDRIFRPHSLRRNLLGMRGQPPRGQPIPARVTISWNPPKGTAPGNSARTARATAAAVSTPSHPATRPTTPRHDQPTGYRSEYSARK